MYMYICTYVTIHVHWYNLAFLTFAFAAGYSVLGWNHPGFADSSVSQLYT